uniref:Uncharacterized protein n=1 Tax=Cacopsylla melanoneura TaxID=428564 RepID=A0A8D8LHP5_9HEMI
MLILLIAHTRRSTLQHLDSRLVVINGMNDLWPRPGSGGSHRAKVNILLAQAQELLERMAHARGGRAGADLLGEFVGRGELLLGVFLSETVCGRTLARRRCYHVQVRLGVDEGRLGGGLLTPTVKGRGGWRQWGLSFGALTGGLTTRANTISKVLVITITS